MLSQTLRFLTDWANSDSRYICDHMLPWPPLNVPFSAFKPTWRQLAVCLRNLISCMCGKGIFTRLTKKTQVSKWLQATLWKERLLLVKPSFISKVIKAKPTHILAGSEQGLKGIIHLLIHGPLSSADFQWFWCVTDGGSFYHTRSLQAHYL